MKNFITVTLTDKGSYTKDTYLKPYTININKIVYITDAFCIDDIYGSRISLDQSSAYSLNILDCKETRQEIEKLIEEAQK